MTDLRIVTIDNVGGNIHTELRRKPETRQNTSMFELFEVECTKLLIALFCSSPEARFSRTKESGKVFSCKLTH